ncbi:cysteine-rich receptor-like protein kinase 40 [Impatiens glandulifera]|uniref:cysteine-rich receptor-like protein kinase 40 n=1 Tax=Impatiens glandulifera TaxID=253017 RepID=UPI001FB16362|nr:cysteine-rich receptor-like protein kinase 40 [Impatiens glandulifera]
MGYPSRSGTRQIGDEEEMEISVGYESNNKMKIGFTTRRVRFLIDDGIGWSLEFEMVNIDRIGTSVSIFVNLSVESQISDFGQAKLCSKEHGAVSMNTAKGTIGYIAPEVFSRNFGSVSHKSDVYSFGIILLGMVGGRRRRTMWNEYIIRSGFTTIWMVAKRSLESKLRMKEMI